MTKVHQTCVVFIGALSREEANGARADILGGPMAMSEYDLRGRVALVTGASAGLGSHFARVLAKAGAAVVLLARREAELKNVVAQIEAFGGTAMAVHADVTDEGSIEAAFQQAQERFGLVSTVIANAGRNVAKPSLEVGAAAFNGLLETNLTGAFLTVREAAKRLIAVPSTSRKGGRFVLISSITARWVVEGLAPYSASKAALEQMGRVLAKDWARHGITVNSLAPGNVETELTAGWFESAGGKRQLDRFPHQRLMRAEDLDPMLLYLSSDASSAVTGSVFTVDDGQSL